MTEHNSLVLNVNEEKTAHTHHRDLLCLIMSKTKYSHVKIRHITCIILHRPLRIGLFFMQQALAFKPGSLVAYL